MNIRKLLIACAALALLVIPVAAQAQGSNTAQVPDIGLGFGPLSVVPVSVGTPVYTAGDNLWVQSYLPSVGLFVSLEAPNGTSTPLRYLQPGSLDLLYTFSMADQPGNWTLLATANPTFASYNLEVTLAPPPSDLVPQSLGANVSQNMLQLAYALPPTDSYAVQECTMGTDGGSVATVQLPSGVGGQMEVALNGSTASVTLSQVQSEFSGWFELYSSRSYLEGGVLVSQEDLGAQSGVFSGGPAVQSLGANLSGELFLREGRYDLRAYIRGQDGVSVFEAPFLKLKGGGWVSLTRCTQLSDIAAPDFTMTTNLNNANTTWPREVFTMYEQDGVDGYTVSNVSVSEARIDLRSSSQVARVPGITVAVTGNGVASWAFYNSGVYVIGTSYPFTASLDVNFSGITQQTYSVSVDAPFTTQVLSVQAGSLQVLATYGGKPVSNATILISPLGGVGTPHQAGAQGGGTFSLPPGEYNVTAVYEGRTASTTVQVGAGGKADASIDLTPSSPVYIAIVLAAVMVVGAGANLFVWRGYFERRETLVKK